MGVIVSLYNDNKMIQAKCKKKLYTWRMYVPINDGTID